MIYIITALLSMMLGIAIGAIIMACIVVGEEETHSRINNYNYNARKNIHKCEYCDAISCDKDMLNDEEIASIREQIMAISLDGSAKAKAKRQELEDQLAEALRVAEKSIKKN